MTDIFEKIASNIKDSSPVDTLLLEKIDNAQDFCKLISSKDFTLDHWRKLILGIYEADLHETFQTVTQHFLKDEIDKKANSKPEDEEKRLTLINTIAAYYLIQASRASEKSKRDEIFGEVMRCTSKSDTINMLHSSLFVLKGYYLFYQGTFDQAVNYFDNGKEYHAKKQCVTAYVGQACVEFCKKEYMKALKLLKAAFKLNPQVPSKLKVALGNCFFTLDKIKKAQKAFEYALESDPNNAEAYLGLAIIFKKRGDYNAYFENLEKSFALKKDHIPTLYELAEHFLYKEDYDKTKKLATHALRLMNKAQTIVIEKAKLASLKIDYYELKSRFNYLLGNCFHHSQNYESAMKHYLLATSLYSNNFVAQYGLGQMYINDRNWQEALTCFEHIVKNCTDSEVGECYRMLAYTYSKKLMKEEAITYYEKAVKFDNQDYECMLEYASYLEGMDNDKALLLYERAIKIINKLNTQLKESGTKEIIIQHETLLNLAVLKHKKGDVDQAQKELQALLHNIETIAEDGGSEKTKGMRFTIMFNLAVILEERMLTFEAITLHNQIIEENPLYFDSYLRLSHIHLTLGEFKKAEEICNTVISKADGLFKSTKIERLKGKSVEALCLLGNMQNQIGDYTKAAQTYNQIKMKYTAEDNYSKLGIAGAYYNSSVALRDVPGDQKKYLKLIGEISKSILSTEESNFIAAMSLGITLAEVNKLSESKDVLNMLLESCQNHKNILLNMAQLEILNKRYDLAIAIFNNYLSKKSTTTNVYDPYTESSLALCYFLTKRYKEARKVYQKLILKFPDNLAYRYNLCAIYYEEAFEILRQENRQIESTKEGVKYLKIIKQQFDFLIGSNKSKMSRYMLEEVGDAKKSLDLEIERIREYANDKTYWISTNFETFMDRLKQDEENEKKKVKVVEDQQKRKRLLEQKEKEKQAAEELKKQKEREWEERARAMLQQAQEAAESMKAEEANKEASKKNRESKKRKEGGGSKRKPKAEEMDDFIEYQGEDGDAEAEAEYNEYQEDQEREEQNDLYQDDDDDEPEYEELVRDKGERPERPEKQERRRKEKKNRLKRFEKEEGEEDEPAPYADDDEVEEPKLEKKRKLVKNSRRRNLASDDEGEEETYNFGDEENQEAEAEAGAGETMQEEPAEENNENGGDEGGSPKKPDDDEEEHYA